MTYLMKKINFYYILFKYILKYQIYIYQIPFLLKSRKNILELIKSNLKEIKNKDIKDIYNKFEYIIDFFTDSKYYKKYIEFNISNEEQNESKNYIKNNNLSISSQISRGNISTIPKSQKKSLNSSSDSENDYITIKFEKIIKEFDKRYNRVNFIEELSNGSFIIGAPNDNLYIYDENFKFKKKIYFKIPSEIQDIIKTDTKTNQISFIKFRMIQNLLETINSKKTKEKDYIEINDCSIYGFSNYSINFKDNDNNPLESEAKIKFPCSGYFKNDKNIILYGEKGISFYDNLYMQKINLSEGNEEYMNKNYKGGIQLNNYLIALTSNKVFPNGEDVIIFYDIKNKKKLMNLIIILLLVE